MKAVRLISCFAACFLLAVTASPSSAQRAAPNPVAAACGSTDANYTVKHSPGSSSPTQPPLREALVYLIETMPDVPWVTKKVNIGLDGSWVGATDAETHLSFVVTKGTHHLCAVYQGHAAGMDEEGQTLLLNLKADAGHIYYIRYHAMFLKDSPGMAFFEKVDEDEGLLLLQRTEEATSTLKK
jgi:hypothetical protein